VNIDTKKVTRHSARYADLSTATATDPARISERVGIIRGSA